MTRAAVPTNVFLELNLECNLRCVQCDIYKLTNPSGELTLEERCGVIAQVADWHPDIRMVFAGGEPFLRRETLYSVAEAAAGRGVYTTISTNGTLIRDADIERLPLSGIRCVVVSLDSDDPEVHDRIRGVPDTFKRATSAIRRLVEARDRAGTDFSVLTSTILGSHNLDRVDAMVSCFESLGVNTTIFQPLQPAFAREMTSRWWTTDPLFPRDAFQVDRGMDQLIAARAAGRRVFQSESGLEDIRYYFKNPRSLVPGQCAAMDRHLMVDVLGDVRLCFNMERIGLRPVANVRTRSLRETWEAAEIEAVRSTMRACREGCGSMLCHAR